MKSELTGAVALITGASRGIGAAVAHALAADGAAVVLAARSTPAMEALAREITASGGRAMCSQCDVADPRSVRSTAEAAERAFGPVNILINNAGRVDPIARIGELTPEDFAQTLAVNLNGAFHAIWAVLPQMRRHGGGTVVNVSSGAAHRPLEGWASYCVSKAGLAMLTQALAAEEAGRLRVFGFAPGTVDTEMQGVIRASGINPISQMARSQHRRPEIPAAVIRYLCTPAADDLVGRELSISDPGLLGRAGHG